MDTMKARELANFMAKYAKDYNAGAFATPMAKEIEADPERVEQWRFGAERTVVAKSTLTRNSTRKDFTKRKFVLPEGSVVATHVTRTPHSRVPDFARFDYMTTYVEDSELTEALYDQGREIVASRVSAAAELLAVWGPVGEVGHQYPDHDLATVTPIQSAPTSSMVDELEGLQGWDDDFPYYSDGSWSSLSLKGFYPEDPSKGVKPAEMPRSWKAANPADLERQCEWTALADRCPSIVEWVNRLSWLGETERVRLLQMSGRGGKGGALGRHTDITDRASGTADGEITRFHVPIITDPRIKLHTWDLLGTHTQTHLQAGNVYYLDARKPHAVTNPTGVDRIHLVIDAVTNEDVREAISNGYMVSGF